MKIVRDRVAHFWSKVKRGEGCWLWTAAVTARGYGNFWTGSAHVGAHRFAYELSYGQIPADIFVCHHCDNPPCVRPDHLFLGDNSDNQLDSVAKGRSRDNRGERNSSATLTETIVREMRARHSSGESQISIARSVGTSIMNVSLIVRRETWSHI